MARERVCVYETEKDDKGTFWGQQVYGGVLHSPPHLPPQKAGGSRWSQTLFTQNHKKMKKAKTISLRLTEQENYWLKALARQSGRTQSEVVRSLIKNGHVKERINRDTLILLRNLMGEATNLNQLARQANAHGFGMIADDCRKLAARISQIVKQIKDDRKDN